MSRNLQRAITTIASLMLLAGAGYFTYTEIWPWLKARLAAQGNGGSSGGAATGSSQTTPAVGGAETQQALGFFETITQAIGLGASAEGVAALVNTAWPYTSQRVQESFLSAYELGLTLIPSGQGDYTKTAGASQFTP